MILLEAPTRTLLFHYKDIKKEIMHTLLLEEYGVSKTWVIIMDKRQDTNAASTPAKTRTLGSGSLLCQEFRRRHEETAWKLKRIRTGLVVVIFMLRVMTCVVSIYISCCFYIYIYVTRDDVRCFL